ncbi:MAG TPA: glycosyltransferase [Candidatus Saccharimonadales bacterium]|nr:glycosyltransferase [Candidatus Saccharimonadales bacterium]
MKIAFFTDDYLPFVHGVTTSIQNYRQAFEALGHEVFIVAPNKQGYDDHDDHVIRLPSINPRVFDERPISIYYPGIAKNLDDYEFDVIHSQTQFYLGGLAYMIARRRGIPHITTIHTLFTELADDYPLAVSAGLIAVSIGFPFLFKTKPVMPFTSPRELLDWPRSTFGDIKKKQGWRLMAEFVNHTSGFVAPSRHLAKTLIKNGAHTPCHVIPNGIFLERYKTSKASDSPLKKSPGEKFILNVGRLSGEKRQKVLVDAMKYLKTPNVRLVLVGTGPCDDELREQAEYLKVADKIIFAGHQPADKVAAIMKQADLFVQSSYRFDNQPMVILEAIASGLPMVYCDSNLTEGLTKENAHLTRGRSGRTFAKAFDELLSDGERLKKMSRASLKVSKEFDVMHLAEKMIEIYKSAPLIEK